MTASPRSASSASSPGPDAGNTPGGTAEIAVPPGTAPRAPRRQCGLFCEAGRAGNKYVSRRRGK